ncbi:MAG: hypothetical protein J1E85_08420 [Ruminococcus sp.]|nr:hypothetical protein [Ruminococcus sp.]
MDTQYFLEWYNHTKWKNGEISNGQRSGFAVKKIQAVSVENYTIEGMVEPYFNETILIWGKGVNAVLSAGAPFPYFAFQRKMVGYRIVGKE